MRGANANASKYDGGFTKLFRVLRGVVCNSPSQSKLVLFSPQDSTTSLAELSTLFGVNAKFQELSGKSTRLRLSFFLHFEEHFFRFTVICCLHWLLCTCLSHSGIPTHPHVVKTASIGTLGRTRTPMIVTVPNAPDVPETSKMLEDVDSVSIAPHSGSF